MLEHLLIGGLKAKPMMLLTTAFMTVYDNNSFKNSFSKTHLTTFKSVDQFKNGFTKMSLNTFRAQTLEELKANDTAV